MFKCNNKLLKKPESTNQPPNQPIQKVSSLEQS